MNKRHQKNKKRDNPIISFILQDAKITARLGEQHATNPIAAYYCSFTIVQYDLIQIFLQENFLCFISLLRFWQGMPFLCRYATGTGVLLSLFVVHPFF